MTDAREEPALTVEIKGAVKSGKSWVAVEIYETLSELGIEVEFHSPDLAEAEISRRRQMLADGHIPPIGKVRLIETQTKRGEPLL